MNKERLLELANFIEKLPPHKIDMFNWATQPSDDPWGGRISIDPRRLDPHQCKTAGCIAGWAIWLFSKRPSGEPSHHEPASEAGILLDLNFAQISQLFYRRNWPNEFYSMDDEPRAAASAIRHIVTSAYAQNLTGFPK